MKVGCGEVFQAEGAARAKVLRWEWLRLFKAEAVVHTEAEWGAQMGQEKGWVRA